MKKLFLLLLFCIIVSTSLSAQIITKASTQSDVTYVTTATNADPSLIVTPKTLNHFFGKKTSYFLLQSNDLSLFSNYAFLDTDEGRVSFGHNFNLGTADEYDYISDILNIGIKSNIVDGFSSFFKDKEFQNDIGLSIKYTHLFKGSIVPDANTKSAMDAYRSRIQSLLNCEVTSDCDPTIDATFRDKYLDKYYELELEYLEKTPYSYSYKWWITPFAYLPITRSQYNTSTSFIIAPGKSYYRPWEFGLSISGFKENGLENDKNKLYGNVTLSALNLNTIKTESSGINKYTFDTLRTLYTNSTNDTTQVVTIFSEDTYIGDYNNFWAGYAKGQLTWYFLNQEHGSLGLNFEVEKYFSDSYKPLNVTVGIPITLKGKDDDYVNLQILAKWNDANNTINSDRFDKKVNIGISVGLPFTSIIN